MSAHRYHPDPACGDHPDAVAWDGCDECESRAHAGIRGILRYDAGRFALLWDRMLVTEWDAEESHRSQAEARICHTLYCMALLMERHFPAARPWARRGAA
jgi:hypothetical protein